MKIRFATEHDVASLQHFLGQAQMSTEQIEEIYERFLLLETEAGIQAAVGYEQGGEAALLRSLVFSPSLHGGALLQFFQAFLTELSERGLKQLYLITNHRGSMPLFEMFGFSPTDPQHVPKEITSLTHFQNNLKKQQVILLSCQLSTKISTN